MAREPLSFPEARPVISCLGAKGQINKGLAMTPLGKDDEEAKDRGRKSLEGL